MSWQSQAAKHFYALPGIKSKNPTILYHDHVKENKAGFVLMNVRIIIINMKDITWPGLNIVDFCVGVPQVIY